MAGRTLGEAWVTIMPDTAGFRTALTAQVKKSMAGFKPSVMVTVNLNADTAKLRTELKTAITAASAGLSTTAAVKTNLDNASVVKTKAELAAATKDTTVTVKGNVDPVLIARVDAFRERLIGMIVSTDDKQAEAQINLLDARANALATRLGTIKTDVGVAGALVQMAALDAAAAKFQHTMAAKTSTPDMGLELALANSQLTHLAINAQNLKKDIDSALSPSGITVGKITEGAEDDLKGLRTGVEAVVAEIDKFPKGGIVNQNDIAKVKTLTSGLGQLSAAVASNGVTVKSATVSYRGWVNAIISIARTQIPLFNGALEKMLPHFLAVASGTHIIIEAALELVAVWVPAAVALTVFGVAASKAAFEVASDVKDMGVAASGTGEQFQGMAKKMGTSMSQLAKPYVFEAYGMALIALQKQSQTTAGVIQTVGGTIDKWISEAVLAYQKGTGKMATQGASDLAILGDAFKQVGTLINGFMKITPGYAKDLLGLGDGILHIASALLNSGIVQAFGKIFLAVHGAIFYLGLFVTLGTKLGTALLSPIARISALSGAMSRLGVTSDGTKGKLSGLMTSVVEGWQQGTGKIKAAVEDSMDDMGNIMVSTMGKNVEETGTKFTGLETAASGAMSGLGGKVTTAAKGIKGALTGMLEGLGLNPWMLAIGAIGAGIFGLVELFGKSTTAAQEFGKAAQTALGNATIATFGTNMQVQMKAAQTGLNSAKSSLSQWEEGITGAKAGTEEFAKRLQALSNTRAEVGIRAATTSVKQWQAAVTGLDTQNSRFNSNLSLISKTAGVDLPTAMNLASQAGLTTKQMMTDTGVAAQEDALQVKGLAVGYGSLLNGIGGVNTAYQAMNIQNSQIMKNTQSVASAFAGYTTLLTGGANAFDTFVQGQATLSSNLKGTGAATTSTSKTVSNYLSQMSQLSSTTSKTGKSTTALNRTTGTTGSSLKTTTSAAGQATLTLGKLSEKISVVGSSLDGISPSSVTANQAFLQQVNNAQALYGSLLQLAAASGNTATAQHQVSKAGKDMISTLLQTAAGSKSAMVQVYGLAQTFGYTGNDTLPALVKWLGTTGDKTKDLQVRVNGLTAGAGNLNNASKALSGELNSQLSAALSKSIIDAEGGQAAFDKFATAIKNFANNSSNANMKDVIKQGESLKQVFISSAGSASAAEPVLQNYFMTLGVKNQSAAKAMANQILGIGKAANATSKPVETNRQKFVAWAQQMVVNTNAAGALWDKLAKNNFNSLSGNVDNNKKKFVDWAGQMGINKVKAGELWTQLLNNKLSVVNAQVDGNKTKFINLMEKMGETQTAAENLWAALKKAPKVQASVNVAASTSGQIAAVASAPGATKQVIGKLFFSAQGHGLATGGKVPGWHNTGDNIPAMGPGGPLMLQGGEAIVPKALATHPEFTNFAKKRGIPGFASGGLVGTDNLVNMTNNFPQYKADVANSNITMAADAMKANTDAAYNALAQAYAGQGGSVTGRQILMDAEKYKGHKYVWGGPSNPQSGWDCSSFAGYVLGHDFHMALPGGVGWQENVHGPVAASYNKMPNFHLVSHNTNDIEAGDLLVENSGGHVGFGVGPNRMFSAYGTAYGTIFSDAKNMTNVYRDGAAGGAVSGLKTGNALVNSMSADALKVYDASSAIKALFPNLNGAYTGDNYKAGGSTQNGTAIFDYLMGALGMTPTAAAGAIASIYGESLWNPDSQGTGGRGLIGWTPAGSLPNSAFTGNATADLDAQLPLIAKFVQDNGDMSVIATMNKASSVTDAANLWGRGVERFGINDVHAAGVSLATSILAAYNSSQQGAAKAVNGHAMGGKIPGMASGGKVPSIATLQKEHDEYAADYHRHINQMNKDKSKSAKAYQRSQAAMYAKKIASVDTQLANDKSAKLKLPKPTNVSMKIAEKLMSAPYVNEFTSGAGSISPLGWALQPVLGDLMIGKAMSTSQWVNKPSINAQASSVMANWVAAMEAVGGYIGSAAGGPAAKLAGKLFGLHGKTDAGVSFLQSGVITEPLWATGESGKSFKFHAGDTVTSPVQSQMQSNTGLSEQDRQLLIQNNQLLAKQNNLIANQGREYAKALNQNASRKVNRP